MSVPDKQTNVDLLNLTSWKAYTKICFGSKQYTDIDNSWAYSIKSKSK